MRALAFLLCSVFAVPQAVAPPSASQEIRLWGSPQMAGLLRVWEADFQSQHPEVRFVNELKSTLSAVPGVYTGRAEIGALGREIWPGELEAFHSVLGHDPLVLPAAAGSFDIPKATFALMVFVHRTNPLTAISLDQLNAAFFASPDVPREPAWRDLGLRSIWAGKPVHLYGFEVENDKAMIFRNKVAHTGTLWSDRLHQFANTGGVDAGQRILDALAHDPNGLAISNIHYANRQVKPLAILVNGKAVLPTRDTVSSQLYPLSREVYLVADAATLSTLAREFLTYVASAAGQQAVQRAGDYLPLSDPR
jgi:phosphate transport system substrate-binding protein